MSLYVLFIRTKNNRTKLKANKCFVYLFNNFKCLDEPYNGKANDILSSYTGRLNADRLPLAFPPPSLSFMKGSTFEHLTLKNGIPFTCLVKNTAPFYIQPWNVVNEGYSLRSRRLEVMGARKNGRAGRRHAWLPRGRPFSLAPTSSKRLLPRLWRI